jgi:hypothetical protein
MPLDLTDQELATAATACRAMAYQEGERAKRMENLARPDRERSEALCAARREVRGSAQEPEPAALTAQSQTVAATLSGASGRTFLGRPPPRP